MNDDNITYLQKVIDNFMDEAESMNETLEEQKQLFISLKHQEALLKEERSVIKNEVQEEMRDNKNT